MAETETLSDHDIGALADPVREIAARAGAVIEAIRAGGFGVAAKDDRTPVTDADHAAEAVILPALRQLTPDFAIVSEEAADRGETGEIGAGPAWLVDPLDGTREFVEGGKEYSVNIGLVADRRPVFGVIHGPALGVTYWTAGRTGAFRAEGGGSGEPIAVRRQPQAGPTVVTSRFHGRSGRLAEYLDSLAIVERIFMSSALKFGVLAEGRADVYPRFGRTSEWDTAAGHAILRAAGGRVATLEGDELAYGKPGYLNPGFIARGATD